MNIFISRPTWVAPEFREGLDGFLRSLMTNGLQPRTLGTTDYPTKGPMQAVIDLIEQCAGAIILGYPQIAVAEGTLRDAPYPNGMLLATEWNHIEAGIAYAQGLPLLVIHHRGVGRGVFDRGALPAFLYERDLSNSAWSLAADIQGALQSWKQLCVTPPALSGGATGAPRSAAPHCPNCSRRGKVFHMSPIPKDFVALERASFECSQCGYKE